jgi:hypothetical protein
MHLDSKFGQIFQYYATRDRATLTKQRSPTTYLWQTNIKDFSYLSILQKDPLSKFFLKKEPGYRLGGCRIHILRRDFLVLQLKIFKTLQLFVSNSKRLGGYTQGVHAHHSRIFQEGPLQGFSLKEPGSSLFHLARPEETRRLSSSTMKHSGAYRYGTHRVPHRYYY